MKITPYPGRWYSDALLFGSRAMLSTITRRIETHLGELPEIPGDYLLFVNITDTPAFKVAGKGGESVTTWEWRDDAWHALPEAIGNFSVIYDNDGTLHISQGGPVGAQGWRYVTKDNRLVTGDSVYQSVDGKVNEFVDLSDAQDQSFLVGQGHDAGGIVVKIDGALRLLWPGACYDVGARTDGVDVCVTFYEVAPDGLTAFIVEATLDELRALPLVGASPSGLPPNLNFIGYGPTIKAGVSWQLDFADGRDDTRYRIVKDAEDKLWVRAGNAFGSDATQSTRRLKVEGVTTPTEPEPDEPTDPTEPEPMPITERFWLAPNIASRDMLGLLIAPPEGVDRVQLYVQNVLFEGANQGPNTKQALLDADVYRTLKGRLVLEMGSVKPGDCEAQNALNTLAEAVAFIRANGGEVEAIAMDEPLTARADHCQVTSLETAALATAAFIVRGRALGVKVGWIEAYPYINLSEQKRFLELLAGLGALPAFWHLDVGREGLDANAYAEVARIASAHGIPLGVIIHSTTDPIATDAAHHQHLVEQAARVQRMVPTLAHVIVQSWAFRTQGGLQDVPQNLGPNGLLDTFAQVRALFDSQPQQPEEDNPMLAAYTDPVKEVIAVKEVTPIEDGLSVWVLPNDEVYSCQPGGVFGTRPAGTKGQWERNRTVGNLGTFFVDGKYITKCFVLVGGLS